MPRDDGLPPTEDVRGVAADTPARPVSVHCMDRMGVTVASGMLEFRDINDLRGVAELYPDAVVVEAWIVVEAWSERSCIARLQRVRGELHELEAGWPRKLIQETKAK